MTHNFIYQALSSWHRAARKATSKGWGKPEAGAWTRCPQPRPWQLVPRCPCSKSHAGGSPSPAQSPAEGIPGRVFKETNYILYTRRRISQIPCNYLGGNGGGQQTACTKKVERRNKGWTPTKSLTRATVASKGLDRTSFPRENGFNKTGSPMFIRSTTTSSQSNEQLSSHRAFSRRADRSTQSPACHALLPRTSLPNRPSALHAPHPLQIPGSVPLSPPGRPSAPLGREVKHCFVHPARHGEEELRRLRKQLQGD